jgi:hypothetical protein
MSFCLISVPETCLSVTCYRMICSVTGPVLSLPPLGGVRDVQSTTKGGRPTKEIEAEQK